jgi:hypothetical protein
METLRNHCGPKPKNFKERWNGSKALSQKLVSSHYIHSITERQLFEAHGVKKLNDELQNLTIFIFSQNIVSTKRLFR